MTVIEQADPAEAIEIAEGYVELGHHIPPHIGKALLMALREVRTQPPAWDGMAVMDHGMRTAPGHAAKQLKGGAVCSV